MDCQVRSRCQVDSKSATNRWKSWGALLITTLWTACPRIPVSVTVPQVWNFRIKGTNGFFYLFHFKNSTNICINLALWSTQVLHQILGNLDSEFPPGRWRLITPCRPWRVSPVLVEHSTGSTWVWCPPSSTTLTEICPTMLTTHQVLWLVR